MIKYIIIALIVIIIAAIITFIISKKKYELIKISIDEANSNIDVLLKKKLELLKNLKDLVKSKINIDDLNIDFEKLEEKKLDSFQLNNFLKDIHNDLFKSIDMNSKVNKNKKIIACLDELNDNEEDLFGVLHFYNDSVVTYNNLVLSFPTNIVGKLTKNKKLEFYSNEKREIFEILKTK